MIKIFLPVFATMLSMCAMAQEVEPKDSLFVVYYTTGPAWNHDKGPTEQTYFADHSKHLSALRKEGVIKLGARAGEKGIIVLSARSFAAAREIIDSDVAIKNGLFTTDLQRFNVFYAGCIER